MAKSWDKNGMKFYTLSKNVVQEGPRKSGIFGTATDGGLEAKFMTNHLMSHHTRIFHKTSPQA
jgi:hypothetical protein